MLSGWDRIMAVASMIVVMAAAAAADTGTWATSGFDGFSRGTFDSAGANLYVSSKGRLQMVRVWDVNADGDIDLFFGQSHGLTFHQPARAYLQRDGRPGGEAGPLLPSNGAVDQVVTDLNNDGYVDLVLLNAGNLVAAVLDAFIYWGSPEGLTPKYCSGLPACNGRRVLAGDLNGDGRKEIVILNDGQRVPGRPAGFVSVYWQTDQGFPRDRCMEIPTPVLLDGDLGDLTGDGTPDLVLLVQDGKDKSVRLLAGKPDGFEAGRVLSVPVSGLSRIRLSQPGGPWQLVGLYAKDVAMFPYTRSL